MWSCLMSMDVSAYAFKFCHYIREMHCTVRGSIKMLQRNTCW